MPRELWLSFSALDTANKCAYKYYLRSIKRIVPFLPVNYPLVSGLAFHALAEEMYKVLNFNKDFLLRNWKKHFVHELEKTSNNFSDTRGYAKQLQYGYGLVHTFHKFASKEGYLVKPQDAEWKFKIAWKDFFVVGKVDLLIVKGILEILDFKTSWKVPTQEFADKSKQLTIYDWAVKTELGVKEAIVGLFYPRKNTILRTKRTKKDHLAVLSELEGLAKIIRNKEFTPNLKHCPKCEFKEYCKYYKKSTGQKATSGV